MKLKSAWRDLQQSKDPKAVVLSKGIGYRPTPVFKCCLFYNEKEKKTMDLSPTCGESSDPKRSKMELSEDLKPIEKTTFKCEICGQIFSTKGNLKRHDDSKHKGEKRFSCPSCGKSFPRKSGLQDHLRTHSGDRPFICMDIECYKSFMFEKDFLVHMRTHTGEKPYKCQICDKKFGDLSGLKAHNRTHTGERPYVCSFCSSKFAHSNNLTVHMRLHTGEQPFECPVCEKKFSQQGNLNKHMRSIHEKTKLEAAQARDQEENSK